jgi:hypothetical protein
MTDDQRPASRRPNGVGPPAARTRPSAARPTSLLLAFFVPALALLGAAAVAGGVYLITGHAWLHWLALHLALLGGVSQLVLGAGQFFVCAFLATDPPSRRVISGQLLAWNLGTVLVAVGVPNANSLMTDAGAALIAVGLIMFAGALVEMQRRSLQRARWAVRWYEACAACLGFGALIGVLLARGTLRTPGSLLGAHLALNLGGWLGTAIVGTLRLLSLADPDAPALPADAGADVRPVARGRQRSRSWRSVRRPLPAPFVAS